MKVLCSTFLKTVILACGVFLITACQSEKPAMTPAEVQRVSNLTDHMTARCVGRYLIDLPEQFVLNSSSITQIEGVSIVATPMSRADFDARLQRRKMALEREKIDAEETPSLTEIRKLPEGVGLVFNRSRTGSSAALRAWELVSWSNNVSFTMTIESTNTTLSSYAYPEDQRRDNVEERLVKLFDVYKRTRPRSDTEIPIEPGVCFANGFVQGPPTDEEWVDMNHHWKGVPDVYFSFSSNSSIGPEDDTLLQRHKVEEALAREGGKTLRKGTRNVNGLIFEEWLMQRLSQQWKDVMLYDMNAEMNSKAGDAERPLLFFSLVSGVKYPRPQPTLEQAATEKPLESATLNAAETMALWDRISSTLRIRPGAF